MRPPLYEYAFVGLRRRPTLCSNRHQGVPYVDAAAVPPRLSNHDAGSSDGKTHKCARPFYFLQESIETPQRPAADSPIYGWNRLSLPPPASPRSLARSAPVDGVSSGILLAVEHISL
ncbi:hypothetical protein BHE74_00005717 [Ensete ventricosum]|nr:hypothetical protein GW17_00037091 [Ensete ventricosum]RWW85591.1 hypothetical protein BHE74_00005717 [Ensete ventricosum]